MASVQKYLSFCFTVRPSNGIKEELEQALVKFCNDRKNFVGSEMVLEKEAHQRHAHIQVWCTKPQSRGDVNCKLERVLKRHIREESDWQAQCQVLRAGTRIAYNDWIPRYCEENEVKASDANVVILTDRPFDTESMYPSEEEQEIVQRQANAVDSHMTKLELLWEEWSEVYNPDNELSEYKVGEFLSDIMFRQRKIMVMKKSIDRRNLCIALYNYINKTVDGLLFYKPPEGKLAKQLNEAGFSDSEINKII